MSTLLGTRAGVKSVRFWQLSSCWWILRWWLLWRPFPDCAQLQKHAPKTRNKHKIIPCTFGGPPKRVRPLAVDIIAIKKVKESFLPVFKDECCDQGCDNHNERHSDCDYLVNCQTCGKKKTENKQKSRDYDHLRRKCFFSPVVCSGELHFSFVFPALCKPAALCRALRTAHLKIAEDDNLEQFCSPVNMAFY